MQRAIDATSLPSPVDGSDSSGVSSAISSSGETARSGNGAGPPAGDVLIELHDVSKAFGKKAILKGTTLKIRRGEAVGIIGALAQHPL
jgi:ATPase subunit of ABC transporter with duplicated ATPase domains